MSRLICTHCGSDALIGEVKLGVFGWEMIIHCAECGNEYAAPMEMRMHTQLDKSFSLKQMRENEFDEKMVKVSFKDTDTGESMTYVSKEENGLRKRRLYIDQPIGIPVTDDSRALENDMIADYNKWKSNTQMMN